MPYAYGATINHVWDTDHLEVYATFRHPMDQTVAPPLALWLLEADEVAVAVIASAWLDEHTLFLTSAAVAVEPTGVTLEYAGPHVDLRTVWNKQWEPWGPLPSYPGYPAAPALHNSTHENGGSDEIQVDDLSGLLADPQHSFTNRGDPNTVDFDQADLIKDSSWYDLDLSAIVPAGAKVVLLSVYGAATTVNKVVGFRKNGNVNVMNAGRLDTQAAGIRLDSQIIVACDENRVIEYMASVATWLYIGITVSGWFA